MAAKGGESRTGLVIFLVLFILLSIGLGVTTYYGYQEADAQKKEADKKAQEAKQWEKDKDYWKFLALSYRSYVGLPAIPKEDLAGMRKLYDGGQYAQARDDNGKEEHKKTLNELWGEKTAKKWIGETAKPSETYLEEIERLKTEKADALKAMAKANDEKDKANAEAEKNKRELTAATAAYQKKFEEQRNNDNKELEALLAKVKDQQNLLDAQGQRPLKDLEDQKKEIADVRKENGRLTKELTAALKTLRERRDEMARSQATAEIDLSKIAPESLAKILSINSTGDMPYISLGSADNLRRQVTFSIFGKGVDGKPLREPKGKLEVIRVIDEHRAQARITDLRDERRDPVLPGDFLYNPAWNPTVKQHVAIIGSINLTGDHRDNVQEFIRTLKNQNVEVDAYMDMKTKKLMNANGDGPGEITRRTDLLIVGDSPEFGSGPIKVGDAKADAKSDVLTAMQKFQDEAEKFGVRIVRLSTFLEMSGYPVPKSLGSENGKIDFHRTLESAGSPVQRRDPPK
jgi:hypothetical protein